jgi:aminopeptidase S
VPPAPTFSIGISPSSQGVKRPATGSATATYTVTLTAPSGYTGAVFLSAGGATTGVSLSLSTASIQNGSGTATLTATVTSSSKKGNHGLTVTGKDATTSKSVSASLQVN